ncbi:MAG: response regulator transcription factor [Actinomycetota bacterium]|nr:response regulator transcription factor [Actinomycetota bacterium]
MQQHTLLIASADTARRTHLAAQFDADGHTVYEADSAASTIAKLSEHAVDVVLLTDLARPADSPALLRAIRGEVHPRIHPAQPVITLGDDDEISTLRAYEAGSDHHVANNTGYFLLRAILGSVVRRALQDHTSRHLQVGSLHIDTAAKAVDVNGTPVRLSRREFDVLLTMAADPSKVFSRDELARTVWGTAYATHGRTIESHVCHLRRRLNDAGATDLVANTWGRGYSLLDPMRPRQQD